MKTAQAILKELILHVSPPAGCAIVLTEESSRGSAEPNWIAACGNLEARKLARYNEKLIELRKADPIIDWTEEKILVVGQRRVAHWMLSEANGKLVG